MSKKSLGFIGGGRITRIFLEGFKKKGRNLTGIAVSDTDNEILRTLADSFPGIRVFPNDNTGPASQDLVFLAVHPPTIAGVLSEVKGTLPPASLLISLAPKWTIEALSNGLGGFNRIARMIPNAASIMNKGFNPIAFSGALTGKEKEQIMEFLGVLGDCPEVEEDKLEAYALLTARALIYFWPQLNELYNLGQSFGLTNQETGEALSKMVKGAAKTLFKSGLNYEDVMKLIPVKLQEEEEYAICRIYRDKFPEFYRQLKG